MTGCLITSDGSEDSLIKLKGFNNYNVLPPPIINPTSKQPKGNHTDVQPVEVDPNSIDDNANKICPDDLFFGPEENESDSIYFDCINNNCM